MPPRDIPEIKEAMALLKSAEGEFPSEESIRSLKEAFEMLNDYLENESVDQETENFISNVKLAHTRAAVSKINLDQIDNFEEFNRALFFFVFNVKKEFEIVCSECPALVKQLEQCKYEFQTEIKGFIDLLNKYK